MYILFEEHPYERHVVKDILKGIYDLQDVEKKVNVPFVGYFYNPHLHDCVFILPKVLMMENKIEVEGKKEKVDVIANVTKEPDKKFVRPEDIITREGQKENLDDNYRRFIYEFSVWIYRALKVFYKANPNSQAILYEQLPQAGKGRRHQMETYLDIVLSLIKYNQENRDFILFTIKNLHRGNNKINWTRTISHSQAFVQGDEVVYLNPVNKKRVVNYEEELFIIFFSILHYLNEEYGFRTPINIQYELIKGKQFQQYRNGMGKTRLMQIKYKYFSDTALKLWDLCYAFFENTHRIAINTNAKEYVLAKNFNIVFEAMIDELIGTPHNKIPNGLADQDDGKRVDHLYRYKSLIEASNDNIYYIGDSKYYKSNTPIGKEALYKQFTYARNVIQWNLDLFMNDEKESEQKAERAQGTNKLRDDFTEGYNIIPNFFISARQDNLRKGEDVIRWIDKDKQDFNSRQFDNRLFDRDTLLICHYDINFLYVLSLYGRKNESAKSHWREKVRRQFRREIISFIESRFDFFVLEPKEGSLQEAVEKNFKKLNGKIFRPNENDGFLILALEKEAKDQFENLRLLFQIERDFRRYDYRLGTDPDEVKKHVEYQVWEMPCPVGIAAESDEASKTYRENAELLAKYKQHKQTSVLFGIYKNSDHLKWITDNKKYNVRLGDRVGAVRPTQQVTSAEYLVLYEFRNEDNYQVYKLGDKHHIMKGKDMKDTGYPLKDGGEDNMYYVYELIGESTEDLDEVDVLATLKEPREIIKKDEKKKTKDDVLGTPIYVYKDEIKTTSKFK